LVDVSRTVSLKDSEGRIETVGCCGVDTDVQRIANIRGITLSAREGEVGTIRRYGGKASNGNAVFGKAKTSQDGGKENR